MYIEPCCCHKQLPKLLRENKNRVCVFQTSGDVDFRKMVDVVGWMAGDGAELVVMSPSLSERTLRFLSWWKSQRHFLSRVKLLTATGVHDLVCDVFGEGCDWLVHVEDRMVCDSFFSVHGQDGCVAVVGALVEDVVPGLRMYAGYFGTDDGKIKDFFGAVSSKIRLLVGKKDLLTK